MKHTSLFKRTALIGTSAAAVCPIALLATSCTPTKMMVDTYDFGTIANFTSGTLRTIYSNTSFKTILYGNKKFHSGNYILVSGSASYSNVSYFFTNQDRIRDRKLWFQEQWLLESILYTGVVAADANDQLSDDEKDIGFYNAIDFFDGNFYDNKNHKIYICDQKGLREQVGPFEKWTQEIITETERYNKSTDNPDGPYEWDDESVTAGEDYIRNDYSAQAFRAFSKLGARLYPTSEEEGGRKETFHTDETAKGQIAFFKDGVLKDIQELPNKSSDFADLILKHYNEEE